MILYIHNDKYYNLYFSIYCCLPINFAKYKRRKSAYTISRIVPRTEKLDAAVLLGVQFTPVRCKLHSCRVVILLELFCLNPLCAFTRCKKQTWMLCIINKIIDVWKTRKLTNEEFTFNQLNINWTFNNVNNAWKTAYFVFSALEIRLILILIWCNKKTCKCSNILF